MEDTGSKYLLTHPPRYNLESVKTVVSSFDGQANAILYLLNIKTGKYTCISRSVVSLFGYPLDIFEKNGLAFFLSLIHPYDYPGVLQEFMRMEGASDRVGTLLSCFEFRARHASGRWLWLENNAFLMETDEKVPYIFGTMKEISARKIKENFLWQELSKREKCPGDLQRLTEEYENLTKKTEYGASHSLPGGDLGQVSSREMEVLKLIADGFSSKQLASVLNISTHTAISHRKHLLEKFKVKNTAELIKVAFRSFWIV